MDVGERALVGALERLRGLTENVSPPSTVRRIVEELERLRENALYVVILGQFKRGKSSLINALLGEDLLPTGIVPVTSAITLVRGSHVRSAVAVFADGRREAVAPGCLQIGTSGASALMIDLASSKSGSDWMRCRKSSAPSTSGGRARLGERLKADSTRRG